MASVARVAWLQAGLTQKRRQSAGDRISVMWAYSLLLGTGLMVSSPWWLMRLLFRSRYRAGLRERLGRVPTRLQLADAGKRVVWVHAVSVGEVLASVRLVGELEAALRARVDGDRWQVVVSTTTPAGQAVARERFGAERVFPFPLDFRWAVQAWLGALEPRLIVLMESELWPRLLAECARRGVPVTVANARMSDRSFRRAMRIRRLWSRVLVKVAVFLAQSEETADRVRQLGMPAGRVRMVGNLKHDLQPRPSEVTARLRPLLDRRELIVAGSLLAPEEKMLLEQWKRLRAEVPEAVLLMAPRHPERFDAVAKLIRAEGFALVRVSDLLRGEAGMSKAGAGGVRAEEQIRPGTVVLLDTVGDLASVYSLADVAFVGGSLVPRGGHNPLEPASQGIPVVVGSSFENFREMVTEMQAENGIEIVHTADDLRRCMVHLLTHRVEADALGQRGQHAFARRSGATARTVAELMKLLPVAETEVRA